MFAYEWYEQDGHCAILPVLLIKNFLPKNAGVFDRTLRVQAYWTGKKGEDEGYYLAFVNDSGHGDTVNNMHLILAQP